MRILAVSDEEVSSLWDHYTPGCLDSYDLILSCGDLKPEYLSFLVTMGKAPVLYVHGNHDENYLHAPPEGCDCIDDSMVEYGGLRILGLGGSRKYRDAPFQYTEKQMQHRIARLRPAIWFAGGVDIVVTHAPPFELGDGSDIAHTGFSCFRDLIDQYHPRYLIHGHMHMRYDYKIERELTYNGTKIVNASGSYPVMISVEKEQNAGLRRKVWYFLEHHNI
ncbi:MAG: metallophosphoesterase family protein [Oscillospiraceae bacterium]|nr:metallophosphoesterase family protein [Oscillospiraceae bacterium]